MKAPHDLKKRITVDDQHYVILRRLAKRGIKRSLDRVSLEKPERTSSDEMDQPIPHSTLIIRLRELVELDAIDEFESGRLSKKNLPIMEYTISGIGLVHLLRLCYGREFQPEIFDNLFTLPYLAMYIPTLSTIFSKQQLFETLTSVCHNTTIEIDTDPLNQNSFDGILKDRRMITAAEMLQGKKGMSIYYIMIRFDDVKFSQFVFERIPIYMRLVLKKKRLVKTEAHTTINKMMACAFFHELILRCSNSDYALFRYPTKGRSLVFGIIKEDPELKEAYQRFLVKFEKQLDFEAESLKNIRRAIFTQ